MATKKKILIIDADQAFSDSLKESLVQEGFSVEQAFSAEQGFITLEFFQPDLVLSEVMLEEHDSGFRLAEQIKRHPILNGTPVFLLSSIAEKTGADFSIEKDGYWMNADDYAAKPLALDALLGRVLRLLAKA